MLSSDLSSPFPIHLQSAFEEHKSRIKAKDNEFIKSIFLMITAQEDPLS
jgi:hypothetical protein